MKLTRTERLILWNQLEILRAIKPRSKDDHVEHQEILENGYAIFYDDVAKHISSTDVSEDACKEVLDILGMYRALSDSGAKKLKDSYAQFVGFDGNEETLHFAFAIFLMDTQGKFDESAKRPRNSHHPTLEKYRRMVAKWKQFGQSYNMPPDTVAQILKA